MNVVELLNKILEYSSDALRDMSLDEDETSVAFDSGRHRAAEDIASMVWKMTNNNDRR